MKQLYIDGTWTGGAVGRTWTVTNPATGERLEDVALADAADVDRAVRAALADEAPGARELAVLLSPAAEPYAESLARQAQALTRRHFGNTVSLYAPLYLSDFCPGGCVYCGFAADRPVPRRRLNRRAAEREMQALHTAGLDEILLLTGERTPQADFHYLLNHVRLAARRFSAVTVEAFGMAESEYAQLAKAGCTGVTLYQETYNPVVYARMHRAGPKRDFAARLAAPSRALAAGIRTVGLGALLGLADPVSDALALYLHAVALRKAYWHAGLSISFPRIQPQTGGFAPPHPLSDRFLARLIWAFRICLPDVHLVLSTRESPRFRDGMAGVGISKMSVASRTTVGGYHAGGAARDGQFQVQDTRGVAAFCRALRRRGLEPVFKNWESVYRN